MFAREIQDSLKENCEIGKNMKLGRIIIAVIVMYV